MSPEREANDPPAAAPLPDRRLFFALWPPPAARDRLAALGRELVAGRDGRPVDAGRLHLTLAFLGSVAGERVAPLLSRAARIEAAACCIEIDRLERFRASKVLVAVPSRPPEPLRLLAAAVARAAGDCGLPIEPRPFRAHVTLARRFSGARPAAPALSIRWPVRDFRLVESSPEGGSVRYRSLGSWPLIGALP